MKKLIISIKDREIFEIFWTSSYLYVFHVTLFVSERNILTIRTWTLSALQKNNLSLSYPPKSYRRSRSWTTCHSLPHFWMNSSCPFDSLSWIVWREFLLSMCLSLKIFPFQAKAKKLFKPQRLFSTFWLFFYFCCFSSDADDALSAQLIGLTYRISVGIVNSNIINFHFIHIQWIIAKQNQPIYVFILFYWKHSKNLSFWCS